MAAAGSKSSRQKENRMAFSQLEVKTGTSGNSTAASISLQELTDYAAAERRRIPGSARQYSRSRNWRIASPADAETVGNRPRMDRTHLTRPQGRDRPTCLAALLSIAPNLGIARCMEYGKNHDLFRLDPEVNAIRKSWHFRFANSLLRFRIKEWFLRDMLQLFSHSSIQRKTEPRSALLIPSDGVVELRRAGRRDT